MRRLSDPLYEYVGKQIRKARKEKGYSLQKLSDEIGNIRTNRMLSAYEQGIDRPNYDIYEEIFNALDMDIDTVLSYIPIVRCKDCGHCVHLPDDNGTDQKEQPYCLRWDGVTTENDYCSHGVWCE